MEEPAQTEPNAIVDFFREVAARSTRRPRAERLRGAPHVLSIAADDDPGPRSPVVAAPADMVGVAVERWVSAIRRRSAEGPPPALFPLAPIDGRGLENLAPSSAALRLASSVVVGAGWYAKRAEGGRMMTPTDFSYGSRIAHARVNFGQSIGALHLLERAASIDSNEWVHAMGDACELSMSAGERFRVLVDQLLAMMFADLAVGELFLVAVVDAPPEAFDRPWLRAFTAAARDITHDRLGFLLSCDRSPDRHVNEFMVAHGVRTVTW